MPRKQSPPPSLRIGVDFGFRFTGLALLDGARVVERAVIQHRTGPTDISNTLKTRRGNRAMRRRARSRRKRLRDFRALLKEMGMPAELPALDEAAKKRPGNLLYGVAHWRGWDHTPIGELLMAESDDGLPSVTAKVRETDDFLKRQSVAEVPASRLKHGRKPIRGKGESSRSFAKRTADWESAGAALENGERPGADLLRWTELQTSCLGGLVDAVREARDAAKLAEKTGDDRDIAAAEDAADAARKLRGRLEDSGEIPTWIGERLDAVFAPDRELSDRERDELRGEMMVRLGLDDGRELHRAGKLYAPNRNRHREKAIGELREKLGDILRRAGRGDEYEKWRVRAESILQRPQRPQKIGNRNPGKCRAVDAQSRMRCPNNVPRRDKPEVRRTLFEIEARQMNIRPEGAAESRKLREDELRDLLACVDFQGAEIDGDKWRAFFKRLPTPPAKRDEDGEELRAKRDQLRDIATSRGKGRTALCNEHMDEKRKLLRDGETESDRWADLHGERVLSRADAKPSLLHRTDKICDEVRRMLARAGHPDPKAAPVVHVGVESARFDIAALSSAEGRKLKKSAYGKKRGRPRAALARAQGGLCIFCGETLGANMTVDHVFAQARGGGDAHKNRAAMCAACNTQKWKFADVRLNDDAMAALEKHDPPKAAFLKTLRGRDAPLAAEVNLAAAQATMFGARVLRGALAEALIGDIAAPENAEKMRRVFPVQRAADLARAREAWFPLINKQKRALRARKLTDDEKKNNSGGADLHIGDDPVEVPAVLQNPDDPNIPACVSRSKAGHLKIIPAPGKECAATLWLKHDDIQTLTVLPPDSRKKRGRWTVVAEADDEQCEVNLREQKVWGKLAAVDGEPDRDKWPFTVSRGGGILRVHSRRAGTYALLFSGRPFRVVVRPAKDDNIREYHHAADAIVAAANADWEKIARMARDARKRGNSANAAFARELQRARPTGELADDSAPPPEDREWLRAESVSETGKRRAKTKREPLGIWKNPEDGEDGRETLVQRCRLDRITRKELDAIIPAAAKFRDALVAAWKEIDNDADLREQFIVAVGSGENKEECISDQWFLQLRKNHPLHPSRVRSVPLAVGRNIRQKEIARLTRGDLNRVADSAAQVREALKKAFADPDAVSGDRLNPEWLRSLNEKHILHPTRNAKVPMTAKKKTNDDDRMHPRDRAFVVVRRGVDHHFDRVENWAEAVLWKNPDGTLEFARRRPPFYRNHRNAEWERRDGDDENGNPPPEKSIPDDAEKVAVFRRGDAVVIVGSDQIKPAIKAERGRWRVKKLDRKGATLTALDDNARQNLPAEKAEKFKNYRALRRA